IPIQRPRSGSQRWVWTRFSRNHFHRRRCAGHWSNFSMAPSINLWRSHSARAAAIFLIACPLLPAQSNTDLTRILERLDRLEQENRTLAGEVQSLRAELAASRGSKGTEGQVQAQVAAPTPPPTSALTTEERLDIQQARIDEQAQTKV